MSEDLQFVYKEEFWFISAFLNTAEEEKEQLVTKIQSLIIEQLNNLTEKDIYRKELKDDIFELATDMNISCKWVPYLEDFPYIDENTMRVYNEIGYFQFDVEYFKGKETKKEKITPMLLQQIPHIVLTELKKFSENPENEAIFMDLESPIYIFATSNKTIPPEIKWDVNNIGEYKEVIAYWTVIYSGQWPDYNDALYERRTRDNLSNRYSEMHFLYRNSAFVYMHEKNYTKFFNHYMVPNVLNPTPRMRAVLFALRSINESLDTLFINIRSRSLTLEDLENKIDKLGFLRGLIQTRLSAIYNQFSYNPREHYTMVLKQLIKVFELDDLASRVKDKFKMLDGALQELYLQKNKENQERTEKGLSLLNLLFGAGILADLAGVILIALSLEAGGMPSIMLHSLIAVFIVGIFIITIGYYIFLRFKMKEKEVVKAVDAIIEDDKGNIILIKRKYPPFKGYYALPGGHVDKDETSKHALIREVEQETNLNVRITKKIGYYKEKGRDPRGTIHSTTYKCKIRGDSPKMKDKDDATEIEAVPIEKLREIKLAFDHKKMLIDADLIK